MNKAIILKAAWPIIILVIAMGAPWVFNAIKLSNCDFEANYRCEVIHVIGLFGPLSWVTVWFDDDKGE